MDKKAINRLIKENYYYDFASFSLFFPNVTQILGNRSWKLLRITVWTGTWNDGTQITLLLLTFTTPAR